MKFLNILFYSCLLFLGFQAQAQEDFRKNAPKPGPPPEIDLGEYENFTLDNGLTVIVVENHKLPRISLQVYVDVPMHKEGEAVGLSSIAGELLASGTTERSKAEIDEAVDYIGASFSSSSEGVFGSGLSKHTETLLEIMAEVILQPAFPEEEFDKIINQNLSGLTANESDPAAMASNLALVLRYGSVYPYGEVMTPKTVESITLEQCREYYNTYFRPNISYLVMVGDLDQGEAKTLAEKYFGSWEKADVPKTEFPRPQIPASTEVSVVDHPSAVQSVIRITYPVDNKPGNSDAMASSIMNDILGNGSNGRLFLNVREDKGYTYGISSNLGNDENVAPFSISTSVRNEVTDSAIMEILMEMERMRDEDVSEDELRRARNVRNGTFARAMESPQTIANFALNTIQYDLPKDYYSTYLERLDKLEVSDIRQTADKYIHPDNVHIGVVGNFSEIKDMLLPFDSDGTIAMYDAYGRPIAAPGDAPTDITGQQVIENYLVAIGGKDALQGIEDVSTTLTGSVQGQQIEMAIRQKAPNKLILQVTASGMVVQEQKYDGEQGVSSSMGQSQKLEGAALDAMAEQAVAIPELNYLADDYTLSVEGTSEIDGQQAYQVNIATPTGRTKTEYYALDSKLKLRSVETQEMQGQSATITNDYKDYKDVGGILWPHEVTTSGALPFPLQMKVTEIIVNEGIDDSVFSIN